MLSNAYFLAKFRFGTAENEPAKNLQNFAVGPGALAAPGLGACRSAMTLGSPGGNPGGALALGQSAPGGALALGTWASLLSPVRSEVNNSE